MKDGFVLLVTVCGLYDDKVGQVIGLTRGREAEAEARKTPDGR